jgi:hypothetical protein
VPNVVLKLIAPVGPEPNDPRRYNLPTDQNEVAVFIPESVLAGPDTGVATRGRGQGRRVRGGGVVIVGRGEGCDGRVVVVDKGGCEGKGGGMRGAGSWAGRRQGGMRGAGGRQGEARQRFVARQEASVAQINGGHFIRGEGGQRGGRDIGI